MKHHPKEHLEELWGRVRSGRIDVCAILEPNITKRGKAVVEAGFELGCEDVTQDDPISGTFKIGSIHSHINEYDSRASDWDVLDAHEDGEAIFAVTHLRRKKSRWQHTTQFYDTTGHELELIISEDERH